MDLITKHYLYLEIHYAIEYSINIARNKQEPDYIAALVTNLPTRLSSILHHHIPGTQFRVGGCFIHQKPLARFCNANPANIKAPEIGDLLVVYKETTTLGNIYYNALILQAKKVCDIYNSPVSHSDTHQLRLYTEWPKFKYERAGILNGQVRSVNPKTITPGAQYLLINKSNRNSPCTLWCAKPDKVLVASNSLAHQLIDFIEFQTGKPFVSKSRNIDHWSKMIWDLLDISATAVFNRRNSGFNNYPRTAGDTLNILANYTEENHVNVDNDSVGISILYIERDDSVEQHD